MARSLVAFFATSSISCTTSAPSAKNDVDAAVQVDGPTDAAAAAEVSAWSSDVDTGPLGSRCKATATDVTCAHDATTLSDGSEQRVVTYAVPLGSAPPDGWPTVIFFQGSFVPGHACFSATKSDPFGMYALALTFKSLLDAGFAVVAPDASANGATFWETNVPPYATAWSGSADDVLVRAVLDGVAGGMFGALDASHMYAMGISSGGFMSSRMAVSYAGRFRALADHSGSYATCSALCVVPTPLPANHPPTLFLHGDMDLTVPMSAVRPYIDALQAQAVETQLVTDPAAGHRWLAAAPAAVTSFFLAHR